MSDGFMGMSLPSELGLLERESHQNRDLGSLFLHLLSSAHLGSIAHTRKGEFYE